MDNNFNSLADQILTSFKSNQLGSATDLSPNSLEGGQNKTADEKEPAQRDSKVVAAGLNESAAVEGGEDKDRFSQLMKKNTYLKSIEEQNRLNSLQESQSSTKPVKPSFDEKISNLQLSLDK